MRVVTSPLTRSVILCGAIAGPLFLIVLLFQDYGVCGFDPRRHLLSQLSLGEWGWIQVLNFVMAGVLNLFFALGLWREFAGKGGLAGPLLIGLYGLFLITAGVFTTDPANGFPPGVSPPQHPSGHGVIHALGGLFAFMSLAAGLTVLACRFLREHRWLSYYCAASAVLMIVFFFGGIHNTTFMARSLRLATRVGWMAASVVAIRLLNAEDSPA